MNASYDRVGQDMPKTQPILESQSVGFRNRADEIVKITSRLNDVANRTFGRMPSEIGGLKNGAPTPMPECSLAKLTDSGEMLDRAISGLQVAVDRFDSL